MKRIITPGTNNTPNIIPNIEIKIDIHVTRVERIIHANLKKIQNAST